MTPNAVSTGSPRTPRSRRGFLATTAVAAAAVAGGAPLLAARGGGADTGKKDGTTSGKDATKILPAFVPSTVVAPDIAPKDGSAAGFTRAVPAAQLKASVTAKKGKGTALTVMAPLWGTLPSPGNPYHKAMNEAIGTDVTWQNQDELLFLLHDGRDPVTVPLPGRHRDLLTGATVEGALKLERYGVAVLEEVR